MRLFRRRRVGVAKVLSCLVVFFLVLRLWKSKLNTQSVAEGQAEALKGATSAPLSESTDRDRARDTSSSSTTVNKGPKWSVVDGYGNFELPKHPRIQPRMTGPGEGGQAHRLRPEQENDAEQSMAQYGMNMVCSDEISLERSVPDFRNEQCKHWNYPENLPPVSVIIVFYNEGFSTLMRTVHSVVSRSPSQFIEEILLVDDHSYNEDLKDKLESYIQRWEGKVRLIRNKERKGLIYTKSRGALEARGEILVFLEAHTEVMNNWLPPLIIPIVNNRTTMTAPLVDSIDNYDFGIVPMYTIGMHWRGIFEWGLQYRDVIVPAVEVRDRTHFTLPYKSPTHAGGFFAINRAYFIELGLYDPGLLGESGENLELSFKVWLCGGCLLWAPCSRVASVYKEVEAIGFKMIHHKREGNAGIRNYRRVVETWMDGEYKEYFYRREPQARYVDMGDISEQLKLKERLQCKSFEWYMDHVAYDVFIWHPKPPPNQNWGHLENVAAKSCIGANGKAPAVITTTLCNKEDNIVRLNVKGQMGIGELCVIHENNALQIANCERHIVDGPWQYNDTTHIMYHKDAVKCMAVDREQPQLLSLLSCDPNDNYQQWLFIDNGRNTTELTRSSSVQVLKKRPRAQRLQGNVENARKLLVKHDFSKSAWS